MPPRLLARGQAEFRVSDITKRRVWDSNQEDASTP